MGGISVTKEQSKHHEERGDRMSDCKIFDRYYKKIGIHVCKSTMYVFSLDNKSINVIWD